MILASVCGLGPAPVPGRGCVQAEEGGQLSQEDGRKEGLTLHLDVRHASGSFRLVAWKAWQVTWLS